MTREEVLEFLIGQVRILKEKHVADLMKENRIDELWEITVNLEFEPLRKFCLKERLSLRISEIPKGYYYELVLYISQSELFDYEIFAKYREFIDLLKETQEDLAIQIADMMTKHNLCSYTIRELVYGKDRV